MTPSFLFSLSLLGLSGLLIDSHRRTWHRAAADTKLPERTRRFALAQYRRRMQASSTIGLIGVGIGLGPLVPLRPGPMALYVALLAASCGWIMLLALLDAWATRQHYNRLRDEHVAAQVRLAMELRAAKEAAEGES